jgi:phosphatidylglycerophosphate synthase
MRSPDVATAARIVISIAVAYLIIDRFNPIIIVLLIAIAIATDGIDGFLAIHEESKGKISVSTYIAALTGDQKARKTVGESKLRVAKIAPYGPRMDVAGDRVMEISLWIAFTYVHVIPLILTLLIIARHAIADALMGAKGTSSKMSSRFAQIVYKSNFSRAAINVLKFVTFSYLAFQYVWNYPAVIGYVLVAALFLFIMARGAAEIYESSISMAPQKIAAR